MTFHFSYEEVSKVHTTKYFPKPKSISNETKENQEVQFIPFRIV